MNGATALERGNNLVEIPGINGGEYASGVVLPTLNAHSTGKIAITISIAEEVSSTNEGMIVLTAMREANVDLGVDNITTRTKECFGIINSLPVIGEELVINRGNQGANHSLGILLSVLQEENDSVIVETDKWEYRLNLWGKDSSEKLSQKMLDDDLLINLASQKEEALENKDSALAGLINHREEWTELSIENINQKGERCFGQLAALPQVGSPVLIDGFYLKPHNLGNLDSLSVDRENRIIITTDKWEYLMNPLNDFLNQAGTIKQEEDWIEEIKPAVAA